MKAFRSVLALLLAMVMLPAEAAVEKPMVEKRLVSRQSVEHGDYLVRIAGCHDCHSPGWSQGKGSAPQARWLTGDAMGWQGPWGTTYATNLRLYMQGLSEEQWLLRARKGSARPPMPWYVFRDMSDYDLRSIYRYILFLGVAGQPAPAYLPPGRKATGPVAVFP